jgi:hypothetical protein
MAIVDLGRSSKGPFSAGPPRTGRHNQVVNHDGLIGKHARISAMQLTRRQWRLSKTAPDAANSVGNEPRI